MIEISYFVWLKVKRFERRIIFIDERDDFDFDADGWQREFVIIRFDRLSTLIFT